MTRRFFSIAVAAAALVVAFTPARADYTTNSAFKLLTSLASASVAQTSVTIVPATTGQLRARATIFNNATIGAGVLWCRADGQPAVIGAGVPILPGGAKYDWVNPYTSSLAINCIASTGTVPASGEFIQ